MPRKQVVMEGELVNLGVTAPAATLALGLLYLQTNDAQAAAAFALPATHFALDYVQPEQLTLRMLMRCLGACGKGGGGGNAVWVCVAVGVRSFSPSRIGPPTLPNTHPPTAVMWDDIQPSEEWLRAQLPPLLQVRVAAPVGPAACWRRRPRGSPAPPLRNYSLPAGLPACPLQGPLAKLMAGRGGGVPGADYEALTQSHCACVAGACLAVGLRYAGSANARAEALLRAQAHAFLAAKQRASEPGTGGWRWGRRGGVAAGMVQQQ
jgi:anaphase-promoting complex subunit 1